MSYKLVVSDVDGTLVDKQKKLTDATVAAVKRLTDADIAFTIISARPMSGMMPIAETLAIDQPMGAFNGGLIFTLDGKVLVHHVIDPEIVHGMFEIVGDAAVDAWVFADDRWYASTDQGVHVAHERIASNQAPIVTDEFAKFEARSDKLTFVSDDPALLADLHARAAAKFGERATIVQSQTYYLDVTALAANKGDGITHLADVIGVPLADTIALGDQANDVAMFDHAGRSIVMGQAPDAVKAKADDVSTANDEDGVAHAIDTFILPKVAA